MKNQNKTRFEVGMPVIAIIDGESFKTNIESINYNGLGIHYPILIEYRINEELKPKCVFTNEGYSDVFCEIPMLYTLPEYEALKALTDSFLDGTFGKEQPKFEPQYLDEVMFAGKKYHLGIIDKGICSLFSLPNKQFSCKTSVAYLYPVEGYQYANGFCIPLKEEQADLEQNAQPTPETTDLLDENGQPVYFSEGMEVGSLVYGKGKVVDIDIDNGNVCANFEGKSDYWHTFDGRSFTGGNQTLYPIAQYNQIQLPKLKPIQVAKLKEDVIELPSWFNGGAIIPSYDVMKYLSDNFNEQVSNKIDSFIRIAGAESLVNCGAYECHNTGSIFMRFSFNCKLYDIWVYTGKDGLDSMTCNYSKNGKDISEKLC